MTGPRPRVASYLERLALSSVLADPGCMALLNGSTLDARSVVLVALDGIAGHIQAKDSAALAWRRIAVRVALAGDGSYRLLSTQDRDALERAVTDIELRAIAEDVRAERTADAADREPEGER